MSNGLGSMDPDPHLVLILLLTVFLLQSITLYSINSFNSIDELSGYLIKESALTVALAIGIVGIRIGTLALALSVVMEP